MAVISDLTWQQLNTELVALGYNNAVAVSGGKVMVDVGVIVGESVDALTDSGVTEFIFKVRQAAGKAQATVNATVEDDEQLQAFPAFSYAQPDENGLVGVVQTSSFVIPLNTSSILGAN
jgi:hypothetical protein